MEGPLDGPDKIQEAAGLQKPPEVHKATGDDGDAIFCRINGQAKYDITDWLSAQNLSFKPTFARVFQKAAKDFSAFSMYPTLGVDSTLPHNRATNITTTSFPAQGSYPVWYFFYGTLGNAEVLTRLLETPSEYEHVLRAATVTGGTLKTWGGKYKALVDGPTDAKVEGSAYQVMLKGHEDSLRSYETDNYEVVRCSVSIEGLGRVQGCTFRFVGVLDS